MGVVMAAFDTSLGRPVAIKFLSPDRATRDGAVERFLREARAAAAIQSEHVVRVFEVDSLVAAAPFIVMERLVGLDLAETLAQRGPLPIDEACDVMLQTCEALAEAHGRGIVHRDLKPSNLFLTPRPDGSSWVKVLDFGISKAADDGAASALTSTGTVMGTPQYMSPEQVRSLKNVDARADIWALGTILYELITKARAFDAEAASAICAMIAMDPPAPLRQRLPTVPPELEAAILRCLHKDPMGRFQDVSALAAALAPFATPRGRLSFDLISKVVHPGPQAAGQPLGYALTANAGANTGRESAVPPTLDEVVVGPTVGPPTGTEIGPVRASYLPMSGRSYPPAYGGAYGPSLLPPSAPHPTTDRVFMHSPSRRPPEKASSLLLPAVLGGSALVLAGVVGAGYHFYGKHKEPTVTAPRDVLDAGPTAAATLPVAVDTVEPPKVSTIESAAPPLKHAGTRPTDKDKEEQEHNAALGRTAEVNCRHHTTLMNTATTDAAHKRAAETAKALMCRGSVSSRCERQVCLNACTYLHDQVCVQQISYVIDHGPPPKY
jgi:serine/threonine-protein kinase